MRSQQVFRLSWEGRPLWYDPLGGRVLLAGNGVDRKGMGKWFESICTKSERGGDMGLRSLKLFLPTRVTLIPTNRCNLRCAYCYAFAGENNLVMPWQVARSAIDVVAKNARELGRKGFDVYFHGGGEPTCVWSLVRGCIDYAIRRAHEDGLQVSFGIATNGCFSREVFDDITEHFSLVSLAFDGPEHVHDRHRKFASGRGSFSQVLRTALQFDHQGYDRYAIVTTVTGETLSGIEETLRFFRSTLLVREIHLGPMVAEGRAKRNVFRELTFEETLGFYKRALSLAWDLGLEISYPGVNPSILTRTYCGAPASNFYVTPEGMVSRCLEVCIPKHPLWDRFIVGQITNGQLALRKERLEILAERTVDRLHHCESCVLRWHCAGDCAVRVLYPERLVDSPTDPTRCELRRELFAHKLGLLVSRGETAATTKGLITRETVGRLHDGQWQRLETLKGQVSPQNSVFAEIRRPQGTSQRASVSCFADAIATCPGG